MFHWLWKSIRLSWVFPSFCLFRYCFAAYWNAYALKVSLLLSYIIFCWAKQHRLCCINVYNIQTAHSSFIKFWVFPVEQTSQRNTRSRASTSVQLRDTWTGPHFPKHPYTCIASMYNVSWDRIKAHLTNNALHLCVIRWAYNRSTIQIYSAT